MKYQIKITLIFLMLSTSSLYSEILISEVCTTNYKSYLDEEHQTPDWIELYNNSDEKINIKDYRISDKNSFENAWILPDRVMNPKERIVIFASGKSRNSSHRTFLIASGDGFTDYKTNDGGSFFYIKMNEDFSAKIKYSSFDSKQTFSNIGLMYRDELTPESKYISNNTTNDVMREIRVHQKTDTSIGFKNYYLKLDIPEAFLFMKKEGDSLFLSNMDRDGIIKKTFVLHSGYDGDNYLGISLSSNKEGVYDRAVIDSLIINDKLVNIDTFDIIDFNTKYVGRTHKSNEIHTNFKLTSNGESLYLWNTEELIIDSLSIPKLRHDISYGRLNENNYYFENPSPGNINLNPKNGIANKPDFDNNSNFFDNSITLNISSEANTEIYYTLDGTNPNLQSNLYELPINISKSTTIKAISISDDLIQSKVKTENFIKTIGEKLNILAISADEEELNGNYGIFNLKNKYEDFRNEGHFQYIDSMGNSLYQSGADFKLHGGGSVENDQKSIRVYAEDKYDKNDFNYQFFKTTKNDKFNKLIFRNAGQDWTRTYIRNILLSELVSNNKNLDNLEYQQVVSYMNSKFWGLYNLRTRIDNDYIATKYDISKDSINLIELSYHIKSGSALLFYKLIDDIVLNDMSDYSNYVNVSNQLDIDNFIDYTFLNLYTNNYDWPDQNNLIWSSPEIDNKWRWIPYDLDLSSGFNQATPDRNALLELKNTAESRFHKLFFSLLENQQFRNRFVNRSCDLINSDFIYDKVKQKIEKLKENIGPYVTKHNLKWEKSLGNWNEELSILTNYFNERPDYYLNQLKDEIQNTNDIYSINLNTNIKNAGTISISTLAITDFPWHGRYLNNIPINIEAIENNNFEFLRWEGDINSTNKSIELILTDKNINLKAVFKSKNTTENPIVINEIMYNDSKENNSGDWIELKNISDDEVNLGGWVFIDDGGKKDNPNESFIFPEGFKLGAKNYLVLVNNKKDFNDAYSDNIELLGEFEFGLSSKGDNALLFNTKGVLIDSVSYMSVSPWPFEANGLGYSLELKNPILDNAKYYNWGASKILGGSPGAINSNHSSTSEFNRFDISLFPNPYSDNQYLEFSFAHRVEYKLMILDIKGKILREKTGLSKLGNNQIVWNGLDSEGIEVNGGVYFIHFIIGDRNYLIKSIKK